MQRFLNKLYKIPLRQLPDNRLFFSKTLQDQLDVLNPPVTFLG
jgi:hypothetical protein